MMLPLYRAVTTVGAPLIHLYLAHRKARGKEDRERFGERLGRAGRARPAVRFGTPREGYPLWMDSVVVLKGAANADNAALFQNFVMAPGNAALISAFTGHANGIDGAAAFLPDDMKAAPEIVAPAGAAEAGVFLPVCPEPVKALHTALWAELLN